MSAVASTVASVLALLAANIGTKLLWAASTLLMVRWLGPSGYGQLTVYWAAGALAAGVADLGCGQALVRDGARRPQLLPLLTSSTITIRTTLSLLLWLTLITIITLRGQTSGVPEWLPILAIAAPLLDAGVTTLTQVCQVLGKLSLYSVWRITGFALFLIALVGLHLADSTSPTLVAAAHTAVTVLALAGFWRALRRNWSEPLQRPNQARIVNTACEGLPFLATTLVGLSYCRAEVLLLGLLASEHAAGLYAAQYQLVLLFYMLPSILFSAVAPKFFARSDDIAYLRASFRQIARYLHIAAWAITPCLIFQAREILRLLGGPDFAADAAGLKVLAAFLPMFTGAFALNLMTVMGRQRERAYFEAAGVMLTLLIGGLLGERLNATSMAIATTSSYALVCVRSIARLHGDGVVNASGLARDLVHISIIALPCLSVFMLSLPVWWLQSAAYIWLLLGGLTACRFWDTQDVRLLQDVFRILPKSSSRP